MVSTAFHRVGTGLRWGFSFFSGTLVRVGYALDQSDDVECGPLVSTLRGMKHGTRVNRVKISVDTLANPVKLGKTQFPSPNPNLVVKLGETSNNSVKPSNIS